MKALSRRGFLQSTLGISAGFCLAGCGGSDAEPGRVVPAPASRAERIAQALAASTRYLIGVQAGDGAWRSELKGPFKDGGSLTPLIVHALHVSQAGPPARAAWQKGADYLAALARPDGTIDPGPYGLSYPVYTAALSALALTESDQP